MTSVARNCKVQGCDRRKIAKELCSTHYRRLQLGQNLETPVREKSLGRTCKLEWCKDKHFARGYCASHLRAVENFGLSDDDLPRLHGTCEICLKPDRGGRRLAVDHDHSCCPERKSCGDCVRGFLCWDCNRGLGTFQDSGEYLLSAYRYLKRFQGRQEGVTAPR